MDDGADGGAANTEASARASVVCVGAGAEAPLGDRHSAGSAYALNVAHACERGVQNTKQKQPARNMFFLSFKCVCAVCARSVRYAPLCARDVAGRGKSARNR